MDETLGTDRSGMILKMLEETGNLPTQGLPDLYKHAVPGSNFAATPQTYLGDGTYKVNTSRNRFNVEGLVRDREPNVAYILNPSAATINHEGQHTQQHGATDWRKRATNANNNMWQPIHNLANLWSKGPESSQLMNANSGSNLREFFATIAELEGDMPEGKTIKDHPVLGKDINQYSQKMIDTYIHPKYNKMMAPDQFVSTDTRKPLSYVEEFRRWVRNKTR